MTSTVRTNLKSQNVSTSREASDHSAGESFLQQNRSEASKKKTKKNKTKCFFEGTVSIETWGIYADLAGLLDAICFLQTQSVFLNQAKSALERLEQLPNRVKTGFSKLGQTATSAELATFITDLLHKTDQKNSLIEYANPDNALTSVSAKQLNSNALNEQKDLRDFADTIQRRLDLLDNKKEHLMRLAHDARLRIEEINHPSINNDPQNLNDATNRTLSELHSASFKAFESQTIRLPKTVLNLIKN